MSGGAPVLTVVVLAWNQVHLTRRCTASVRATTTVPYELVVVDNGSAPPGPDVAREVADVAVLSSTNRGFAAGMNAGLDRARGEFVAFLNNDTVLPPGWDVLLLEHLARPSTGIVAPVVTAAGHQVGVRRSPGDRIVVLPPFRAVPSGVLYLLRTRVARELRGWDERFFPAGAEDADLCFSVWVNGLDVVLDERVLVDHVGKASASQLNDHRKAWAVNRQRLLRKWRSAESAATLAASDPTVVTERRRQARLIAWAMTVHFATVGKLPVRLRGALLPWLRRAAGALSGVLTSSRSLRGRAR